MKILRHAADFLRMGRLALTLELTVGLQHGRDVVDGAFVELFECCVGTKKWVR